MRESALDERQGFLAVIDTVVLQIWLHHIINTLGDSVGMWDGDTLVIDTVGLAGDLTWLDGHGNRHSDALQVVERWRRISANQIWYEHTIDDPKFYTKPWTTGWVIPLASKNWEIMEYACTTGNEALEEHHLQPGALGAAVQRSRPLHPLRG